MSTSDFVIKSNILKQNNFQFVEDLDDLEKEFLRAKESKMHISCNIIVLNQFGQFLILKRNNLNLSDTDSWCFPGGGLGLEEQPKFGALRELREETGIDCSEVFYLQSLDYITKSGETNKSFYFICHSDQIQRLSHEYSQYKWANYKDTQELLHHQDFKNSIHFAIQKIYPTFALNKNIIDYSLPLGERGIAIIQAKETNEFVVYDKSFRGDTRIRFPGGHVDLGENAMEATMREVEEEVGLVNLEYIKHVGSSQGFYNWSPDKSKIIYKLDHVYFFTVSIKDWNTRKPGIEQDIKCFLADKDYILTNSNDQQKWLMASICN